MRSIVVIALMVAASNFAPRGASAERVYPWCAYYDAYTYNCGFISLQQCLATTSGVGGACRPNPYGAPVAADAPRRRHKQAAPRY
jgi:hypothetical protein